MKKALIAVATLAGLLIVAVLAAPFLVPAEKIKAQAVEQVKAATGRDLIIDGKLSVSVFPSLAVRLGGVSLSNPPGFKAKDLVRLDGVDIKVKLLPLLSGDLEVDSFVLDHPVINLEVDAQGHADWEFAAPASPTPPTKPAAKPPETKAAETKAGGAVPLTDLKLGDIRISGGKLVYADAKAGTSDTVDAIDLQLSLPGFGQPLAVKGGLTLHGQPMTMSIAGRLTAEHGRYALAQAALQFNAIKATGDFSVDVGNAKPAIKATLDVDMLDLNPYLPPDSTEAKPAATTGAGAGAGGKQDWSDDPIDASGLKAVEADLTLKTGGLKVRKLEVGKSRLDVALHGGKLTVDLAEMDLYKGQGKGRLAIDGAQPGVGLDATFALKGLQAQPFLAAAAGFERLEGTGNVDLQVAGRGHSQRQIVSALGGKGAVSFTNGAIRGINLASMLRNVTTAFTDNGGDQKTDFAELGGTFTIASGIVSNQDLALMAPLIRVGGAGTVDLPKRTLNYRVEPKVAATTQGQGGQKDVGGLSVPVIIEGPWSNLSYRPDLAGMAGNVGQAAKGLVEKALPGGASGLPINPGALFGK